MMKHNSIIFLFFFIAIVHLFIPRPVFLLNKEETKTHIDNTSKNSYLNEDELNCLALNIYHEGRNQSYAGKLAIGLVTINRAKDNRFPETICGVVFEGPTQKTRNNSIEYRPIKNKCQFSWHCDGKSDAIRNESKFEEILHLSKNLLENNVIDFTDGATHYHATYVTPWWAKSKTRTVKIDAHIFYRWEER